MNTFNLTLDLAKAKQRQQQTIFVRQGDQNATTIMATITDHGAAASTSGMTARFQMRLPNGTEYYRKTATLSGNTATVTIDEAQAASAVGRTDTAYFQLLQGSTVVASTESFTVTVLPDALADATVPESYDSAIQEAIDNANEAADAAWEAAQQTIPDGSVTTVKLASNAVTADKIADAVRKGYVRGFETVAAMQAATDLKAGMTCHTNGFNANGDGGAAWYTIDTTGTADGENVIACTGSLYAHKVTHAVPFSYSELTFTGTNGNKALVHYAIIPSDYKPELVLSGGRVNQRQYEIDVAYETQSFVLINAGIFNTSTGNTEGIVITDSTVQKNEATTLEDRSVLYMTADGVLGTASSTLTGSQVLSTYHPIWAVTGFYPFVENGEFTGGGRNTTDYQPRSCIAQDTSGNYLVFACSGRKYGNQGMSIADMYAFLNTVGFSAQFAYNLDGGASSSLTIMGVRTNNLTDDNHRSVANFIAFKNPKGDNAGLFQATKPAAQFILRNDKEQTQLYSTQHWQYVTEGASVSNQIVGIDKSSADYVYTERLIEAFDTNSGLYRLLIRRPQDSSAVQAFALNSNYKIGVLFDNNIATQKVINYLSWGYRNKGTSYTLETTDKSQTKKWIAVMQQAGINFFVEFYPYNFGTGWLSNATAATPSGDIVNFTVTVSGSTLSYDYTASSGNAISMQRLIGVDHL